MSLGEPPSVVPLKGARRIVADRMMHSLQSSAQLTYHAEADVTDLMAWRSAQPSSQRPSLEDCLLLALTHTLVGQGDFNATLEEASVTRHPGVHVAVAVASPSGLVTPVLRDLQARSLEEIGKARRDLVERAAKGRLAVSEMKGATFTLSNLGHTAVTFFTPILNPPQVAILGLGRVRSAAAFSKGAAREVLLLPLSLTADHRWIDGDPAGRFLAGISSTLLGLVSHLELDAGRSPAAKDR